MKLRISTLALFFLLFSNPSFTHVFQFDDLAGDHYILRTFSIQEILINNIMKGVSELKYEGNLRVQSVKNSQAFITGSYLYYNKPYMSSQPYKLMNRNQTNSRFNRKANGEMEVSKLLYFPVVRNIPTFPKRRLHIGEKWYGTGYEVQDLRSFGVAKPYILPFQVEYQYIRDERFRGRDCAVFSVHYLINQNNKMKIGNTHSHFPARVMGYFKGYYYWDKERNYPLFYEAEYDFIYILMNGQVREWRGIDYGDVIKKRSKVIAKPRPKPEPKPDPEDEKDIIKKDLEKKLKKEKLKFPVHKRKVGISINLGELLFDFNSTKLKQRTIRQLDKLAKLLMQYDHYQLRVDGHTDSIGTHQVNLNFSRKRAKKVRDYLVSKGVIAHRIKFKGFGETKPVDSNKSGSARAKNRRVEVIILVDKKKTNKN